MESGRRHHHHHDEDGGGNGVCGLLNSMTLDPVGMESPPDG